MSGFYIGTSVIGITAILFSLVLILLDKKQSADYAARLEEEKRELAKVIEDSEQMLDELNKFSDYVINQVDKRSTQLAAMMSKIDEQMGKLKDQIPEPPKEVKIETVIPQTAVESPEKSPIRSDVINNKHREVLAMVEKGMSDAEIAKALNMGKGEVQLILGMNINKLKTGI